MWKPLVYNGELYETYEVQDSGEIRHAITKLVRKLYVDHRGYQAVTIYTGRDGDKKITKCIKIHRAVAGTFLDNPEGKQTVNHKDGNKLNNALSNLEWSTQKENNEHQMEVLGNREKFRAKAKSTFSKKILQFSFDGILVKEWNSTRDVERCLGYRHECVAACARGARKTAYGHIWKYVENVV